MTNELQNQAATSNLPNLATVKNLPSCFPLLGLTAAAIHGQIFKSQDRFDSKGRKIPGNGLAATGAIIRRGRKVQGNIKTKSSCSICPATVRS